MPLSSPDPCRLVNFLGFAGLSWKQHRRDGGAPLRHAEDEDGGDALPYLKRLPKVVTEMALHVLAYNLTRVMNIVGIQPLMAAICDEPATTLSLMRFDTGRFGARASL